MCEVRAVSISGYRAWRRGRKPDRIRLTDPQAVALMKSIHAEVKAAYGARRMHRELQRRGHRIGLRRVERLMREHGIRARHKRRFKATMDSKQSALRSSSSAHADHRRAWRELPHGSMPDTEAAPYWPCGGHGAATRIADPFDPGQEHGPQAQTDDCPQQPADVEACCAQHRVERVALGAP